MGLISRWICEIVELRLDSEETQPRGELANELVHTLREKNHNLQWELRPETLVLEKYETELLKLRNEAIIEFESKNQNV